VVYNPAGKSFFAACRVFFIIKRQNSFRQRAGIVRFLYTAIRYVFLPGIRGRQQSLERGELIDLLEPVMKNEQEKKRRSMAELFIGNEEMDSGIIRVRGNKVEFWHLTFLEYLAARELAGMKDENQQSRLLKKEIIEDPNWRETLLLFIGVLWSQGRKKVEGFFSAMLNIMEQLCQSGGNEARLSREARCFGLMGAMLRDLQPYEYTVGDPRFAGLKERIEAIFDAIRQRHFNTSPFSRSRCPWTGGGLSYYRRFTH